MSEAREFLARSLSRRAPTHEVARAVLKLGLRLPDDVGLQLLRLAQTRSWHMADDFDQVVPAADQLTRFAELFPSLAGMVEDADPLDYTLLREFVSAGMRNLGLVGLAPSAVLAERKRRPSSVRKRVRFLRRLAEKAERMEDTLRLRHAQMQAKSRFAYKINPERCDDLTLAFCAYLAARANRRSLFMVGSQSRAKDKIVEGLHALLVASSRTDWLSVCFVQPTRDNIERLAPEQRGWLISAFHAEMAIAARELGRLWPSLPERMRAEMVVVKGIDSSRWNAYAGALNTMRSAWISAVLAAGLDEILDRYLPGKTPRLMASDVAWMYRGHGMELHEDTRMFGLLRHPWEVVNGETTQGRSTILDAAERAKISAEETGWVGPHQAIAAERPEPEPALVHGVVVTDPELARTLKRCGVFSGKRLRHLEELVDVTLTRDVHVREDGALVPVVEPWEEVPA